MLNCEIGYIRINAEIKFGYCPEEFFYVFTSDDIILFCDDSEVGF